MCFVDRRILDLAVRELKNVVFKLPKPWKEANTGRPGYDPRIVAIMCFLKVMFCKTYDSLEAEISRDPRVKRILNAKKLPGHSVCHRGMLKLRQSYVRRVNNLLVKSFKRRGLDLTVDSTGFSTRESSEWYDIRIRRKNSKKVFEKLHALCSPENGLIYDYRISDGNAHDSPFFRPMLNSFSEVGKVAADPAYLSRENCQAVADKKGKPYIKPRINVKARSKNHPAWRRMILEFRQHTTKWLNEYHIRSFIESVFRSVKARQEDFLYSLKKRVRRLELAMKVVCYNVRRVLYIRTAEIMRVDLWVYK